MCGVDINGGKILLQDMPPSAWVNCRLQEVEIEVENSPSSMFANCHFIDCWVRGTYPDNGPLAGKTWEIGCKENMKKETVNG